MNRIHGSASANSVVRRGRAIATVVLNGMLVRVVAEGIETETVLATLRQYACDIAQGYFLARPMPAEGLQGWLAGAGKQSRR